MGEQIVRHETEDLVKIIIIIADCIGKKRLRTGSKENYTKREALISGIWNILGKI